MDLLKLQDEFICRACGHFQLANITAQLRWHRSASRLALLVAACGSKSNSHPISEET